MLYVISHDFIVSFYTIVHIIGLLMNIGRVGFKIRELVSEFLHPTSAKEFQSGYPSLSNWYNISALFSHYMYLYMH